ncbi:carboxypeptidase-like regulatory domain-containing protein [Aquimarina macrocephali]|uniref:carboxypeptidase-like regulatory domain-containing protein n=1 Tax=Aquimarina macrocephali TaxID=666563 RepID=UPI000A031FED|nr:carboxypeptidase-like regulatory domain-containing protein [Aquimarina macrocephali]
MSTKKHSAFLMILIMMTMGESTLFAQSKSNLNKIYGYVTSNNIPLKNVNVSIQDKNRRTITDENGYYYIEASEKEVIYFSFVGKKTIEVIVEDVTQFLNIKMIEDVNTLDEVLVKTNRHEKHSMKNKPKLSKLKTAYGEIDLRSSPFASKIVKGEDLNVGAIDLIEAIRGRIPIYGIVYQGSDPVGNEGMTVGHGKKRVRILPRVYTMFNEGSGLAIWDVDGFVYEEAPHIDLNDIAYVAVLRSVAARTKYGTRGAGGVIVVTTKSSMLHKTLKTKLGTNENQYQNNAFPYIDKGSNIIGVLEKIDSNISEKKVYETYKALSTKYQNSSSFYLDVANYFRQEKENNKLSLLVLSDMEKMFDKNAEALKALAYKYQELGEKLKALHVYNKIIHLRPSYAQSFRDLANVYSENKEYQNAWDMYMRYLRRGFKLEEKGIEQVVYNEMKYLYTQKKEEAKIKEVFKIKKEEEETLTSDVRVVFEWNTSEAEFLLEFVDPQLNSFAYEHSWAKNSDRISDEKLKGYSSDEFFIYDLGKGEWLINITYLGNKKYAPTYLKATVYKNWGRENQTNRIKLFKLKSYNYKIQLFKFNSIFR